MSYMKCTSCESLVNTKADPESLEFSVFDDECWCEPCRYGAEDPQEEQSHIAEHGTYHNTDGKA